MGACLPLCQYEGGWGGGASASCSPEVELLARLRSSSATQEKLQYPLGTPAAVLPPNGSPEKEINK